MAGVLTSRHDKSYGTLNLNHRITILKSLIGEGGLYVILDQLGF